MGNPLDWSAADKCILGALTMLFFNVWYALDVYYAIQQPAVAPYLNRPVLEQTFQVQVGFMAWWISFIAGAACLRRRAPDSRLLVHVALQSGALNICVASYLFGHYTNLLTGVGAFSGAAIVIILFDRWATIPAIVMLLLLVAGTTVAEQLGSIPYAPLLTGAPLESGHLSTWWLASIGGSTGVVFVVVVALIDHVVGQWRDREYRLARANDIISRYVASQLAAEIRAGRYASIDRRERRKLTLFFSDIRDFSAIADTTEPEDLAVILDEYLSEMIAIGQRYGATIDKFVGDAIMIFFGAPMATSDRDHALRAVRMAIDMQGRMQTLAEKWRREGVEQPFEIRIGINTGQASIGNFGSKGRLDYTAIGRQVNLAARLQEHCAPGSILVSHSTWSLIQDEIECEPRGDLQVKGFRDPVKAYQVVEGSESPARLAEHPRA